MDSLVIGAGQGGLSASYHLRRLRIDHVVLDADAQAGGAWQHRWDSLTMADVHGVADLPGSPAPPRDQRRANVVIPAWFAAYEERFDLPVIRPVRVDRVEREAGLYRVRAGDRDWLTRTLVNATGTWTRPFVPYYPGAETFTGEQIHTSDYPGPQHFRGRRVAVVGGGASAVQFLGEIAPIAHTLWFTRRPPAWRDDIEDLDGRAVIQRVAERVRVGQPPQSVTSQTGIGLRPQEQRAAALGAYRHRPMFTRIEPTGVRLADGSFEAVDAILWATGFRPAIGHLTPLHLTGPEGGIRLLGSSRDVQTMTTVAADPRVQLVGYGPSASTIGGNRAGHAAALAVRARLAERYETSTPTRASI